MTIKVWRNFQKRKNSTKQPNDAMSNTINAVLKDNTSIESPTFEIATNDFEINYVYALGHYYFVTDIISVSNGLIDLVCMQDVLATHRNEITGYYGYVEYTSASDNVSITDNRNIPTLEHQESKTVLDVSVPISESGFYLVGLINKESSVAGGITYYACTTAEFQKLKQEISAPDFWEKIYQQFTSLNECIVSCTWLPLNLNALLDSGVFGGSTILTVANENLTDARGYKLSRRYINVTPATFPINFPNNYGFDFSYMLKAPYTTGTLFLPFVGVVNLDLDAFAQSQSIRIGTMIDVPTGDIIYEIDLGNSGIISTYAGNLATKVPMSSSGYDAVGVASGVLSTIGGVAGAVVGGYSTGGVTGAVVGGVSTLATGSVSVAKSSELHSMMQGSISSGLGVLVGKTTAGSNGKAIVTVITNKPAESNLLAFRNESGMPYYKHAILGSLYGFIKCTHASINLGSLGNDTDEVNSYLNSGFYLE